MCTYVRIYSELHVSLVVVVNIQLNDKITKSIILIPTIQSHHQNRCVSQGRPDCWRDGGIGEPGVPQTILCVKVICMFMYDYPGGGTNIFDVRLDLCG